MIDSYKDIADSLHLLGGWTADDLFKESMYVRSICEEGSGIIKELLDKLDAYEETELTPEEFHEGVAFVLELNKKLKPYMDADEQGRLVILPCQIGDTIYEIDLPEYGVIVCNVLSFTYGRSNITGEMTWCVTVKVIEGHGFGSCYTFAPDDFGKTVFLTREEAEAALKGETKDV